MSLPLPIPGSEEKGSPQPPKAGRAPRALRHGPKEPPKQGPKLPPKHGPRLPPKQGPMSPAKYAKMQAAKLRRNAKARAKRAGRPKKPRKVRQRKVKLRIEAMKRAGGSGRGAGRLALAFARKLKKLMGGKRPGLNSISRNHGSNGRGK